MPAYNWVCHRCSRSNAAGTEVCGHCHPTPGQPPAVPAPAPRTPAGWSAGPATEHRPPAKDEAAWTRMIGRFDEYRRLPKAMAYAGLAMVAIGAQVFLFADGWAGLGLVIGGVTLMVLAGRLNDRD